MSLSSRKIFLMRGGTTILFFSSEEEDKEEDKKEGAKNETMESQQRKIIEENFSFRVLYQKKRSTQNLPFFFTRKKSARSRVCVCVCVCRFRATRVNNTYTHRKKWRQTGCLVEETPRKRVVLSVTPKEIITRAKTKTVVSARQQHICFPRKATSKTNETIHTIRKKRGEGERKSPNSF